MPDMSNPKDAATNSCRPADRPTRFQQFSLPQDPTHPIQVSLRTYALALSLSLGPALVPFIAALIVPRKGRGHSSRSRTSLVALARVLRRELGIDGFAFAITLAVGGGSGLKKGLDLLLGRGHPTSAPDAPDASSPAKTTISNYNITPLSSDASVANILDRLRKALNAISPEQQTLLCNFLSSAIGVLLLQAGRTRSRRRNGSLTATTPDSILPTLDLTLLLFVRAVDSVVQAFVIQQSTPSIPTVTITAPDAEAGTSVPPRAIHERLAAERIKREQQARQKLTSRIDAFVFWACSARIMWCFFYEPNRLPRSYVNWINALANFDGRIVLALQRIREGTWSYRRGSPKHAGILEGAALDFGYPASWGNPEALPAYGGAIANKAWEALGVTGRRGVGGIPCEVIHAEVGQSLQLQQSCTANAVLRMFKGFIDALAIYLPVHFLPTVLTKPQILIRPHRFLEILLGSVQSAAFLSSFIGLYWYAVCFTRSLVLARLLPFVSHDFWDGPYGCIMAGCLMCGASIWVENGRRRGEMALYVLPKALRACLPDRWIQASNRKSRLAERLAFALSLATLLTSATHRPESLRGLSRWTLAFVKNGPSAGFWKRKRQDPSLPPTPGASATTSDGPQNILPLPSV